MHEMGIVQSILGILEQQAEMYKVKRILKVNLEFGALTAVQPDALQFAFEVLAPGTVVENAQIDIEIIPVKVQCLDCSAVETMDNYEPFCPKCKSPAVHILEGRDEMRVASMEVDDGSE